jgi:hypothetical protein
MVMFRMMHWNLERFTALQDATEEAVRFGQRTFTVDLDRKHKGLTFNIDNALTLVEQLAVDFVANPQPQFPENREGAEP